MPVKKRYAPAMRGIITGVVATLAMLVATVAPAQARDPEATFQPTPTGDVLAVVNNTTHHAASYRIKAIRYYSDGARSVEWFLQAFRLRPWRFHEVVVPFNGADAMFVEAVRLHWGIVATTRMDNPAA